MANSSIYNAFERMWQHNVAELEKKEDKIYSQNDEPVDAVDGSLWIDLDAEGTVGGTGANTGGGSVNIDTTLTKSGQSADAKAVGDALATKQPLGDYATEDYVDDAISSIDIPSVADGKSAYQYAQDGGYTGTEEEFAEKLAEEPLFGTTAEITPSQVAEAIEAGRLVRIVYTDKNFGVFYFTSFDINLSLNGIFSSAILQYDGLYAVVELIGDMSTDKWQFIIQQIPIMSDVPTKTSQLTNDSGFLTSAPVTSVNGKTGAVSIDIPTVPSALKNPYALTINGTAYDGSEEKNISGLATETYVDNKIAAMVNSAPDALNTLNELAAALGDDPNFATTIATQIGNKLDADAVNSLIDAKLAEIANAEGVPF